MRTGPRRRSPRQCLRGSRKRVRRCWTLTASTSAKRSRSRNRGSPARSGQAYSSPARTWCAARSGYSDDGEVWIPGEEGPASVSLCRLGELGQVGPDRRDVWDGFERTDTVTAYPMVENHDTEQRRRLVTEPDTYLAPLTKPRPGRNLKAVAQLWPKAGRLLVAERLWLETARVAAMWSETRVLSNVWWPIRVGDAAREKALAVWLNSSLGLLTLLAQRTSTRGGWVAIKKGDLEKLPVLDVRALSQVQLTALSDVFDELTEAEFERLPANGAVPGAAGLGHRRRANPRTAGPAQSPRAAGLGTPWCPTGVCSAATRRTEATSRRSAASTGGQSLLTEPLRLCLLRVLVEVADPLVDLVAVVEVVADGRQ